MRILLVHGIVHADQDPNYYQPRDRHDYRPAEPWWPNDGARVRRFLYDNVFDAHYHVLDTYAAALAEFLATATSSGHQHPLIGSHRVL
jgi:hypothetical protein